MPQLSISQLKSEVAITFHWHVLQLKNKCFYSESSCYCYAKYEGEKHDKVRYLSVTNQLYVLLVKRTKKEDKGKNDTCIVCTMNGERHVSRQSIIACLN